MSEKLDEIAGRAVERIEYGYAPAHIEHFREIIRAALGEAVAEERKALQERWITCKGCDRSGPLHYVAREAKR